MSIMLATDLCRLVLREQPPELLSRLQLWSAASEEIVISALTYAELVAAALLTREPQRHMALVEAFCQRLDAIVSWDGAAVDAYTRVQYGLMAEQKTLNMNDVMIAAHALGLDARLLTTSGRSFEGIDGLQLQVWPHSR